MTSIFVKENRIKRNGTPQVPYKYPTSDRQEQDRLHTDNSNIIKLIQVVGEKDLSVKEIMEGIGLKDRKNVLDLYLKPSISGGFVRMLHPQSPRHPRQKYLLTVKGLLLLKSIRNGVK